MELLSLWSLKIYVGVTAIAVLLTLVYSYTNATDAAVIAVGISILFALLMPAACPLMEDKSPFSVIPSLLSLVLLLQLFFSPLPSTIVWCGIVMIIDTSYIASLYGRIQEE